MEFTGINVTMLKNLFVFGGKNGVFMTQGMGVYVDGMVVRVANENAVVAKV